MRFSDVIKIMLQINVLNIDESKVINQCILQTFY